MPALSLTRFGRLRAADVGPHPVRDLEHHPRRRDQLRDGHGDAVRGHLQPLHQPAAPAGIHEQQRLSRGPSEGENAVKRIMLLIGTNLAIMLVLGIVSTLTGAHRFFTGTGLDLTKLLFFAGLMGFGGAFISLCDVQDDRQMVHRRPGDRDAAATPPSSGWWTRCAALSQKAGLAMPEVARLSTGEPNAFATGASRNSSLVAVSTGLLQTHDAARKPRR
ncbi:MAG: hypothetical protein MZV63_40095 [Marinilabiliales bacterium]|nr:hypothetical protein [Marinilabiliales bacterium]